MALVCCRVFEPCQELRIPEIGVFTGFTAIINAAIVVYGLVKAVDDNASDCTVDKMRLWLFITVALGVCNIIFGFYLYMRISAKVEEGSRIFSGMWKIFLYDCGVFLYLIVFIFMIVWAGMGSNWMNEKPSFDLDTASTVEQMAAVIKACDETGDAIQTECALLTVYMVVGGIIMCFAVSLACCRTDRPNPPPQAQHQQGQAKWYKPWAKPQGGQPPPAIHHQQHQHQQPPPQQPPPVQPVQYQQVHPHQQQQQQAPPPLQQHQYSPQHAPPQQYPPQHAAPQHQPPQQYPPQHQQPPPQQAQPQHQPHYQQPQHQHPPQHHVEESPSLGARVGGKIGAGFGKVFGK